MCRPANPARHAGSPDRVLLPLQDCAVVFPDWHDWPYFAGDGYFRILGRGDDVINVVGTREPRSSSRRAFTIEEVAEAAASQTRLGRWRRPSASVRASAPAAVLAPLRTRSCRPTAGSPATTTTMALVYAVLVETGLNETSIGKLPMSATFVTDFGTVAALLLLM